IISTKGSACAFCAGRSVRNIHRAQGVCLMEVLPRLPGEGSPETPPEPPFAIATLGRGSRLRDEPTQKFSGAAMAAIGQKDLPVIVWNIHFHAGITLCHLYFCKHKGR